MSITQQDVARESGVSISTVCLVLRDDPRISDRTRQRVLENATALGYVARTSLRAVGGHQHLGVLLANPSGHPSADTFFGEVLHGITEEAELQGQTVSIAAFDGAEPPRLARENRVHGLILGGTPIHPAFVERVRAMTVPSVFIGRYAGHLRLSAVLTDNSAGGQLATEHLLQLGRRQIAFVSGPLERALYADRLDGFLRAHREADVAPGVVRHGEATVEGGFQMVTELLSGGAALDALFIAEDVMALGALRALKARGVRVPEDIAVVGYSDVHLAGLSDPPLTTVHVARRRLGRSAARLIGDLLSGNLEGPIHVTVPPKLVVRASCGARIDSY